MSGNGVPSISLYRPTPLGCRSPKHVSNLISLIETRVGLSLTETYVLPIFMSHASNSAPTHCDTRQLCLPPFQTCVESCRASSGGESASSSGSATAYHRMKPKFMKSWHTPVLLNVNFVGRTFVGRGGIHHQDS